MMDRSLIEERHRHRYEFNNEFRDILEKAGLVYSGLSPDGKLVEVCELANHPWMVGCQFHPEFGSRPNRPHPLFLWLYRCSQEYNDRRGTTFITSFTIK